MVHRGVRDHRHPGCNDGRPPCRMTTTTTRLGQRDQDMVETEHGMLTEKQKMQSCAVEERAKAQRDRIDIERTLKRLEHGDRLAAAVTGHLSDDSHQNVSERLALRRRATAIRPRRSSWLRGRIVAVQHLLVWWGQKEFGSWRKGPPVENSRRKGSLQHHSG